MFIELIKLIKLMISVRFSCLEAMCTSLSLSPQKIKQEIRKRKTHHFISSSEEFFSLYMFFLSSYILFTIFDFMHLVFRAFCDISVYFIHKLDLQNTKSCYLDHVLFSVVVCMYIFRKRLVFTVGIACCALQYFWYFLLSFI